MPAFAQKDFVRIGVGGNFREDRLVQTISFDLNRTEKVDEKASRFVLFNRQGYYLTPNFDVNLGDGLTSAENNISVQINFGKLKFGTPKPRNNNLNSKVLNTAWEINPSTTADKNFDQRLYYGQFKYIVNLIDNKYVTKPDKKFFYKKGVSVSLAPVLNAGYRRYKVEDNGESRFNREEYLTAGLVHEMKMRWRKEVPDKANYSRRTVNPSTGVPADSVKIYEEGKEFTGALAPAATPQAPVAAPKTKAVDNLVFKITGSYYYIVSDAKTLRDDDFAGLVKVSLDKHLFEAVYLNTTYKYGNDTPSYAYVHTLEFGLKIQY
ncbi:MAG: hypothetical protein ACRYG7_03545 [Janthinobacterium lividum]